MVKLLFANDTLIAFLSVMCALFSLHLVLKRDQITRAKQDQTAHDIESLLQLKKELKRNLDLCASLIKYAEAPGYFQTEVWEKYRGSFPLFHEELRCAARCYESFNNWNEQLRSFGKIDATVIENHSSEMDVVVRAVNNALKDFS